MQIDFWLVRNKMQSIRLAVAALICLPLLNAQDLVENFKPHFIYMQRLREYLSATDNLTIYDSSDQTFSIEEGQPIATSIEALNTHGRGYSENGFVVDETNRMNLTFTIPIQSSSGDEVPSVELWFFPDRAHIERNRILEVTFRVMANVFGTSNSRNDDPRETWDTNEDCFVLNMTTLSKKISRVLQKRNLNESKVHVSVEVINTRTRDSLSGNSTRRALNQDLCSVLSTRGTNDSFLVIKNYQEHFGPMVGVSTEFPSLAVEPIPRPTKDNSEGCRVVPLVVNLAEVYGSFIKGPTRTDIKDCSGKCTLLQRSLFSKHAEVKERLKLLPGGEELSNFKPTCIPMDLKPLHILISIMEDTSGVIVQLPDLIVERCACQ